MPSSEIDVASRHLKSQFFEGLDRPARKTILAGAIQRQLAAKSAVIRQGGLADRLFLLTKGYARHFYVTEEGKKFLLEWLGPGDLFGARTILSTPSSYLAGTEMVTESSALVWDRTTIRRLVEHYPRLLENVLLTASDYVTWHLMSHIGIASYTARQRLAEVLITLARTVGQKTTSGVTLDITNQELADAANITVFTASRLISEWQRTRALAKRRGKILLQSPDWLFSRPV
jgi:CRP/FNR family transcriptional regulator, nitrogen oxide reductase regulator